MLDIKEFFKKYNMEYGDYKSSGIDWEELQAIHDHYGDIEQKLRGIGKDFVDEYLYDIEKAGIHSYRYRTKEPGHLVEKIITPQSSFFSSRSYKYGSGFIR